MITGQLKNKIDKIWDDMYSYGIANPLVVIEQLTYLFFIKSLDDVEIADISVVHAVENRVHGSDTEHGLIGIISREHLVHVVAAGFLIQAQGFFVAFTNVLACNDQKPPGATGWVRNQVRQFWFN